jgi:hypothetical protein
MQASMHALWQASADSQAPQLPLPAAPRERADTFHTAHSGASDWSYRQDLPSLGSLDSVATAFGGPRPSPTGPAGLRLGLVPNGIHPEWGSQGS